MKFTVKAIDPQGRDQEFTIDAPDQKTAVSTIRARGFFPFEVTPYDERPDPAPRPPTPEPIPQPKPSAPVAPTTLESDDTVEPIPQPKLSDPVAPATPESDDTVVCIACGSHAVQLLSVTKRDIGTALFADLIGATAAGVTAGRKNLVLNTCMKCGAQWAPGTSESLDQIKKRQEKEAEPYTIGCFIVLAIVIIFIGYSCYRMHSGPRHPGEPYRTKQEILESYHREGRFRGYTDADELARDMEALGKLGSQEAAEVARELEE